MLHTEQWIWLPDNIYPESQSAVPTLLFSWDTSGYAVAEFTRQYRFPAKILRAEVRFGGDTALQLYCNGQFAASGPAWIGGDFIGNHIPRENFYALETTLYPQCDTLDFFARVRLAPEQICEYSSGRGGFMLSAIVTLEDGRVQHIGTGGDWLVRKNGSYVSPRRFDSRILPDPFVPAQCIENRWHTVTAPIPVRQEYPVPPGGCAIDLAPGEEKTLQIDLGMIWGGYLHARAEAEGETAVTVNCRETGEEGTAETLTFAGGGEYRGFFLHSAGNLLVRAENCSPRPARITLSLIAAHYPVTEEADTVTADPGLNQVLATCKHTLKICRQTIHLDSTRHCEPLACTGDYYIQSLMTPFAFGDMRLAEFDLLRTAGMLEREKGRMFHTTYSLIWVRMLWDVYCITGKLSLLEDCKKGLGLLLDRFGGYLGENGLIENPPDYMFVDWIYIDGHSLHHPPKALGQSCMNMYYFAALDAAGKIYEALSVPAEAACCAAKRETLAAAVNARLFDREKGMFFEGLNTPTDENLIGEYMPPNTDKRYYLKHSNILAACFGVCDDATAENLVHKVMSGEIGGEIQPYFTHFLLEAVFRLGLRETYTRAILERWIAPVRDCPLGLVEGFVAPEPGYGFDHSHAWGGTPLYSLPKALLGLTILSPGMQKIALSPSLLGLEHARVELLTPGGRVTCRMEKGKAPCINAPEGITVILK